jgi:hypothetical protein
MSFDRFVYFPTPARHDDERVPTVAAIREALACYVDTAGQIADRPGLEPHARFTVDLPGAPSTPTSRHRAELLAKSRWFEVFVHAHEEHPRRAAWVNVMTYRGDEFTAAVADGFAAVCTRLWLGARELHEDRPRR